VGLNGRDPPGRRILQVVGAPGRRHGPAADVPADRRGSGRKIETGIIGRGAQLPSELALREEYDASRNTIRDASNGENEQKLFGLARDTSMFEIFRIAFDQYCEKTDDDA